jgi:hypothetical protein
MSDYDDGYEAGLEAGRDAKRNSRSDSALGQWVGDILGVVETVAAEQCNAFESDEYKEGFRKGVRDGFA